MRKRFSRSIMTRISVPIILALLVGACLNDNSSVNPGTGGTHSVTGRVVGANGQPIPEVPVVVPGHPPSVTDGNGYFTITNVSSPYTLVVVDGKYKRALVYRGLTRPDPTLTWLGSSPGTPHEGTLQGSLIPWSSVSPGVRATARVAFSSSAVASDAAVNLDSGSFSLHNSWFGPPSITGTIYALTWTYDVNNLPTTFEYFGRRTNVPLGAGQTNTNQDDTLNVVPTGFVSGTTSVPAGYTITSLRVYAVFESRAGIMVLNDFSPSPSFFYSAPGVPGVTLMLLTIASKPSGEIVESFISGLPVSASNVAVQLPAAPGLILPIDNASGVNSRTPFMWTPSSGGVHLLEINSSAPGASTFIILTSALQDSIPDLSWAGLSLPLSTAYQWAVLRIAPFASVDAAAGPSGTLQFVANPYAFTGFYQSSATRAFTTAP